MQTKAVEDWTDRDYWRFAYQGVRGMSHVRLKDERGRMEAAAEIVADFACMSTSFLHLQVSILCAIRAVEARHWRWSPEGRRFLRRRR